MATRKSHRIPTLWQGFRWSLGADASGGGTTPYRMAWRALNATLWHSRAMKRWMTVVYELHSRKVIEDMPGEYLRAVRPYVHRGVGFNERVVQLIDHMDWLEGAFQRAAFEQIVSGQPLTLVELTAPRGYDYVRLQLQQAPLPSPEGDMLLSLNLQRSADVQHKAENVEAAVLAFSRFRIDDKPCLVIGGVRGQRHPTQRVSLTELSQALQGWKPSVLLVRVAQELARYWQLHLIGLDPAAHRLHDWSYRWKKNRRESGQRIFAAYDALWDHFDCKPGPLGWVVVPLNSDEKLAATALSPEKRARQTSRADYWIRTRNVMRAEFRRLLQKPVREARLSHLTETMDRESMRARLNYPDVIKDEFDFDDDSQDSQNSEDMVPSRVLATGPGNLV
ncbi:DUF535 domain-containing protein [Caenimonas koreensis DSM 17982]|uniref:DUF535 domain-containing protein n=1 Tax=Caenimonas koreensis DSM 17982 TaxID=1121255 RepID=A0A844AW50_9BURK|nr:DUF535 family protein [Caenimonas koreensis]MRD48740.1 DUF535 domain-containing protein [Caenimonas koreensis DSM 17982]